MGIAAHYTGTAMGHDLFVAPNAQRHAQPAIAELRVLRTSCRQKNTKQKKKKRTRNSRARNQPTWPRIGLANRSWMSMEAISSMATTDLLADGGELGARKCVFVWSTSPLGPPAHWPQSRGGAGRGGRGARD